jgi:uncharacterized membrane protein YuzA (DUF378 family)
MAKHKVVCWIMILLVVVGALNWGLVGLGGLIGNPNLNVVHLILGGLPAVVENIVYLLVGLAGLGLFFIHCKNQDCGCQKMEK